MKFFGRPLTILYVVLLLIVTWSAYGQEEKKAYRKFKSRSSTESTAPDLLNQASKIKVKDPREALNKVEEALGISLAQGDEFSEGKCYELIGEINEGIQEWKLALQNYSRAYQRLSNNFSSSVEYQKTVLGLGSTTLQLSQFGESLKFYQEALTLDLVESDRQEVQLDISEVYYQMGDYEKALEACTIPQSPASKVYSAERQSYENRLQNQRAKIYARKNELEKSKDLYQNSINSLRSSKSVPKKEDQSLQNAKEEIAGVLHDQKRYDDEISLRNKAIEYNLESKNLTEVTKDKVEIGKTLIAKGENQAALKELEDAARIADTLNNPKEQANAFLVLAQLYEKNGKLSQALAAYKRYSRAVANNEKLTESAEAEKSGIVNKQKDITELISSVSLGQREDTIERATVFRQQLIIYGLLLIILIIGVTSYFIYKNSQASKLANQLLALKSLRGQMNPHFIFNALNSVNQFIAQQDERTANRFLSEFSQLMRLVMENSQEDFIPLEREQEILSLYIKLEHYRFRDKFTYEIDIDSNLLAEGIEVPPMLIQPYIENAVWHGLRYKDAMGKLSLRFQKEAETLVVEITDNGIGRARSAELKTANQKKHHSTGLKNIQQRLTIINKVYKANYRVIVDDLENAMGTKVRIYLPVNHRINGTP